VVAAGVAALGLLDRLVALTRSLTGLDAELGRHHIEQVLALHVLPGCLAEACTGQQRVVEVRQQHKEVKLDCVQTSVPVQW